MSRIFFTSFFVFFFVVNSFCNVIPEKEESISEKCPEESDNYFMQVVNSIDYIGSCAARNLNSTVVEMELEEAKVTGKYNEIIQRVCLRDSSVFECVTKKVTKFDECTTTEERNQQQSVLVFARKVMNYICSQPNNPLARFFAENGVERIHEKITEIGECATNTYSNVTVVRSRVLFEEICEDLTTSTGCLLSIVDKFENPGITKSIKGLFKIVFEEFACDLQIVPDQGEKKVETQLDGEETLLNINVTNDL